MPGGDIADLDFERFLGGLQARYPFLPSEVARRLGRSYGTRVQRLLGDAKSFADLGGDLGAGLSRAELDYLAAEEWAKSADDVLWRRSKLGLHVPPGTRDVIEAVFQRAVPSAATEESRATF